MAVKFSKDGNLKTNKLNHQNDCGEFAAGKGDSFWFLCKRESDRE
jgi:hypothetical protein